MTAAMTVWCLQKSGSVVLSPWELSPLSVGPATLPPAPGPCYVPASHPRPGWSLPTGDLLIIMAQVIVAIQMVLEEKFVYKHNVHPLRAVGTEGVCARGLGAGTGRVVQVAWGAEHT